MKIYFAGSIRGGRDYQESYFKIISLLKQYGEVLTEHIGDVSLSILGEEGRTDNYIYTRDTEWLAQADVMVAEVTTPSLGVGYELAKAEEMKKPTLCLFQKDLLKKLSAMISGDPYFKVEMYENEQDLKVIFDRFFLTGII